MHSSSSPAYRPRYILGFLLAAIFLAIPSLSIAQTEPPPFGKSMIAAASEAGSSFVCFVRTIFSRPCEDAASDQEIQYIRTEPTPTAPPSPVSAPAPQPVPQIVNNPVVERVVETRVVQSGGISKNTLATRLSLLRSELLGRISSGGSSSSAASGITHDQLARQTEATHESIARTFQNLRESLEKTLTTVSLTVSGALTAATATFESLAADDAAIANDLTVGGTLTANVISVQGLSSAGALVGPYVTATSTTGSSSFMGSVGIGTTSPYAKLSVVGAVVAEYFHATSTAATSTFAGGLTTGTSGLNVHTNGSVGIGTTSPVALLGIQGAIGINTQQLYLGVSGVVGINTNNPSSAVALDVNGVIKGSAVRASTLNTTDNAKSIILNNGSATAIFDQAGTQVMNLVTGNVGIGTTNPVANLDVAGNIVIPTGSR